MAGLFLNRSRQVPAEDTPAFAGIAERFRRAGDLDRAIALCRDGLKKFPKLLSARVTLGWALLDKGQYDEARTELEQVLRRAPDNLAAIRGLAELHERAESTMPIDAHAAWHQAASEAASEEDHASIDTSVLVEPSPAAAPVAPAAAQPAQPIMAAVVTPVASAAASVPVAAASIAQPAPVTAAASGAPVSAAGPSSLAPAEMPPAPVVSAASALPVIEFTNSAGAPLTPAPEVPAVAEPEAATARAFDAPLSLEAQPVEEASALDALDEFSLELPAAQSAVSDLDTSSPVLMQAADDIDFGAAMPEPVLDEELPAPAAMTPAIELDLPSDLVAQLEAAEDPSPDVLTLPVAAEVNLDALASVFSDDIGITDETLVPDQGPPFVEPTFESATALEEAPAAALIEEADVPSSDPFLQKQTTPAVVSELMPAIEETASAVPEMAAASALDPVPAPPSPLSLAAMSQTALPAESEPARVDLAGFAVGSVSTEPAASAAPTSLSEMFGQPAAASQSIAPPPVAAPSPPVIVSRSPLPDLERFLRKVQARRMQIAVGSVA